MTLSASTLFASHQLAVVAAAEHLVDVERRGGVRHDVIAARLALGTAVDALRAVRDDAGRQARAEDDTRPLPRVPR